MKSSRATFTCDFCHTPVDLLADTCPSCGKRFEAVRCPRCAHQGPPGSFRDGCPRCGYLASSASGSAKPSPRRPRALFVPLMTVIAVLLAAAFAVSWLLRPR